jgi:tripartite-type tricarboxylate transporter receptor subunit TctC
MIQRRQFLKGASSACLATMAPGLVLAQGGKTTTVTVGFAPGGPGEVLARRVVEAMRVSMGQNIIVNNRPGAGGMLAAAALKGAPSDGSALIFSPPGIVTTQPLVNKRLPYDPSDLEPVAGLCEFSFAFAVRADHPAKNLKEFVEWVRKNPAKGAYGVLGLGNMPHFIGYRLGREAGVQLEPVGYKGAKEIVNDMLGGNLPSGVNVTAAFAVEHKAGTLRVLGVTGLKRVKSMPDVPTFAEQGFPSIVVAESFAFYGPKGIPKAEADRVYRAVLEAVKVPEVLQFMNLNDFEPAPITGDRYKQALQESITSWAPVIRASGFQVD